MNLGTLTISLAQMDVQLGQPAENLATMRALIDEAAGRGSDIVVLPELWSTGYDLAHAGQYATMLDEGSFAAMAATARQHDIAVVGSCLSWLSPERYGNTAAFFRPDGRLVAAYTKIHLFGLMDEEKYLWPGLKPELVTTTWGAAGLAICYDLRFPELFRYYALAGAQMVILPAEWPKPRLTHWQTLLRARAIENQLFVVACNRVGQSGQYDFFGHSCIIDPWGETVLEAGSEEALLTATIDLDTVTQVRAKMPVLADRRPSVYLQFDSQELGSTAEADD